MIAIQAPKSYINEDGITAKVGEYVTPLAKHILIITSPKAWQATKAIIEPSLEQKGIVYTVEYLKDICTKRRIDTFAATANQQKAELILAVGGGRVLDVSKAVGEVLGQKPVIALPTIAATCAAWSPITVLYDDRGAHVGPLPLSQLPIFVLVDSEIIARSPVRYLKAGIVDSFAKWFEFYPYLRNGDDGIAMELKAQAAKFAIEIFKKEGEQAVRDNEQKKVSPALRRTIDAVIALAGIANSMKDDVPRIGAAHAIHHSMTRVPELNSWLHGEKVGFGLAIQNIIESPEDQVTKELKWLLEHFASPLHLDELGVEDTAYLARRIAEGIKVPEKIAERLPFSIAKENVEKALLASMKASR
ncbi:iron-containing alcohol dehydrogenase family protein [Zymomonas mobilis]|uniref:Iron-containing alcohol dehydrogenase n=1 Tax=Zymomonas mobilis subsp. mobilis (strain ATCC 31821 / ZM4 / CP4) TaxID=264203 RepID=A0A806CGA9_ZYMMO|nr:iron-containing alcohol dehydrogenase family protein [Zymomonas mobilis]ADC33858.1 iron-containing alcohol dehydrogenase [Zymomonas mobilis subsp. mobilis ZM4 = ATCC 31821]AHB11083.1 glycerol dehydrogenase-like oxidoreductase [Zymomonas mobilis subsp. mobilis str. CP4 = NRRL B-14023]AHJ71367.1 Glycerol dehydrogenase [Zymomonas mobilis subsp. mobilis NRRL B-12526]AHJ73203.1 Glycerol dehydrogenase [Zymomonas mobilis subsp. mobilis str. CP4 = NRRL B-14023]